MQIEFRASAKFTWPALACLALVLVALAPILTGCPGPLPRAAPVASGTAPEAGAVARSGQVRSATGCLLNYEIFPAGTGTSGDWVVLAHGFLRGQRHMAGLARELAAAGISTATVEFCNMRPWDGGHFRNGLDLRLVADTLAAERVVYAGFSAGGLAALVAASQDRRALGVVALDLVDARGLGERIAAGFDRPLLGLIGEPSSCNANNNGLAVYAASDRASTQVIADASHCDFESPSDWLCRLVCESDDLPGSAPARDRITAATREAVMGLFDTRLSRIGWMATDTAQVARVPGIHAQPSSKVVMPKIAWSGRRGGGP